MTEQKIFIFLPSSWVIFDKQNRIIQTVEQGYLDELTHDKNDELIVFVPSEDVLLTEATLPKLSRQRLQQALPFALEEQLIPDVSELHFASGNYQPNGKLPVAVVSKQKMTDWLDQLSVLAVSPKALIPSVFLLPFIENHWMVNSYRGNLLVRTDLYGGFACEEANKAIVFQLKLDEQSNHLPIQLDETQLSPVEMLKRIAPIIHNQSFINLLQDAFQAKTESSQIKKIWTWVGYLALACLGLLFLSKAMSLFFLQHHFSQMDAKINALYYRHFPQAHSVIAPRERLTEKLNQLTHSATKNNLLGLLSLIASHRGKIHIEHLDFRDQRLTLDVNANSFDILDNFTRTLIQQGLKVKQQNATMSGTQVKATLLITSGELGS